MPFGSRHAALSSCRNPKVHVLVVLSEDLSSRQIERGALQWEHPENSSGERARIGATKNARTGHSMLRDVICNSSVLLVLPTCLKHQGLLRSKTACLIHEKSAIYAHYTLFR
jgi:hypothetical protein